MSNGKICAQCKSYVGCGDWDMCCGKQVRRLTYCDSKACDEFEQNDTCTNRSDYVGGFLCSYCGYFTTADVNGFCPKCKRPIE